MFTKTSRGMKENCKENMSLCTQFHTDFICVSLYFKKKKEELFEEIPDVLNATRFSD